MKMAINTPTTLSTQSNFFLSINVEILFGLNVMMPMLEAIHSLIKFAQLKDVFVYNFITIIKVGEGDVYCIFYDMQSSFEGNVLNYFTTLINNVHKSINLCWNIDMNTKIDHLAFEFDGQHMWAISLN
jgi:hypothetical protein